MCNVMTFSKPVLVLVLDVMLTHVFNHLRGNIFSNNRKSLKFLQGREEVIKSIRNIKGFEKVRDHCLQSNLKYFPVIFSP